MPSGQIERMRELCRVKAKAQGFGYALSDVTNQVAKSATQPLGSSSTVASISAQDALRTKLQQRKQSSQPTSPHATDRTQESETSNE
jgi:hypothetical protein